MDVVPVYAGRSGTVRLLRVVFFVRHSGREVFGALYTLVVQLDPQQDVEFLAVVSFLWQGRRGKHQELEGKNHRADRVQVHHVAPGRGVRGAGAAGGEPVCSALRVQRRWLGTPVVSACEAERVHGNCVWS